MRPWTLPLLALPLLAVPLLTLPLAGCKDGPSDDSAAPVDADGDGVTADEDCDDNNPAAYPGGEEVCDGADNDCNGYADDEASDAPVWYIDYDGDGVGVQNVSFTLCEAPAGYVAQLGDCDDTDPATYPGAVELCDDSSDNSCDGLFDCDDSGCTGDAACAPVLTEISPALGHSDETTPVTIRGAGFAWATVGAVTVTVGGVAATEVVVVDGNTLSAKVPPGPVGPADVVLSTDNGDATLSQAWRWYSLRLVAGDGKQGTAGNLYELDLELGSYSTIGPIGYAVTGLAFSPAKVLYATEATRGGTSHLLVIDPDTGAGSVVGELRDSSGTYSHGSIPDITFIGERLFGWTEAGDQLVEIDPATGLVTTVGSGVGSSGSGLAYDAVGGALYFQVYGSMYAVDPSSGAATYLGFVSGLENYGANSMTHVGGALYATDMLNSGGVTALGTIDPETLLYTKVMDLPDAVDAIAGF